MKIEFKDDQIDVKDIMKQIKENIAKHKVEDDVVSQLTLNHKNEGLTELESHTYVLNKIWNYTPDIPVTSHRKWIGPVIVLGKKVIRKLLRWYINPFVEKQVDFNAHSVRAVNTIANQLEKLNNELKNIELKRLEETRRVDEFKQQVQELKLQLQDYHSLTEAKDKQIDELTNRINGLAEQTERLEDSENNQLKSLVDSIKQELQASIRSEQSATNHTLRIAAERMRRIERKLSGQPPIIHESLETPSLQSKPDKNEGLVGFDYFLFEEYYRGSREEIKDRMKRYLKYFEHSNHVLDLGCGRGEFTELLLEQGKNVTSIDLNDDMVEYCRERGYPILQTDIFAYLESLDDQSVDGIFLGQVIEHLTPNNLIRLVNLSFQKLSPNGWFIAETPNPQCLSVFMQSFYMDLTHTKPVHPYTAKFILESAGFQDSQFHFISPNDEHLQLPEIVIDGVESDSLKRFNETVKHWNHAVFGYQDYYIAGRR